ncbi:MAG: MarR family transcriptional regulator [Eubacteriales bacterium]|nr:MarR family transcriptional regulator [Eubacteriales bacterium]
MENCEIRERLHRLDLARKKILRPKLSELGLTVGEGQARTLQVLRERGAMSQRELSDLCMLDVTTMSRNLDKLERAGLLTRQPNPSCRRSFLICLTEEGQKRAKRVQEIFRELDDRLRGDLQEKELDVLCGLLERLEENLGR